MAKKITENTRICQFCGNAQETRVNKKTGKRTMVKHGYTRPWVGGETGACEGTDCQPYNETCADLTVYIRQLRNDVSRMQNMIDDITSNPPATTTVASYSGARNPAKITSFDKPEGFVFDSSKVNWYNKPSYEKGFYQRYESLTDRIKGITVHTAIIQQRVNDWQLVDIK